ncbi:MAG TPA: FAD-dependent oxidoreductase, partial [Acidimicrobiales bacterium]
RRPCRIEDGGRSRVVLMAPRATFVIVGAGLAGSVAAETLRSEGFDGRIVLVGEEPHVPYSRPPLSKGLLRGEQAPDESRLRSTEWYDEHAIDLCLGVRATEVDPAGKTVALANGRLLRYDKALVTTGCVCRTLPVPGADLPGVLTLRTLDQALAIRQRSADRGPVVIIGAGFIGSEVAASARTMGCEVTVLEVAPLPMGRVLGAEVGRIYAEVHRDHGVDLRTGVTVERIEGGSEVRRVVATDGPAHEAALVVMGVGVDPDVEPVLRGGVTIGNGIVVDEYCQTSARDLFAAGDIAYHPNPILGRTIRLEHWQNAQHQGAAAARNMLGAKKAFAEVPWFWSDQYDLSLQMAGLPEPGDTTVFRGDVDGGTFSAFYLRNGLLEAVVGVNRVLDVRMGRRLIGQRIAPTAGALSDESVNLSDLAT